MVAVSRFVLTVWNCFMRRDRTSFPDPAQRHPFPRGRAVPFCRPDFSPGILSPVVKTVGVRIDKILDFQRIAKQTDIDFRGGDRGIRQTPGHWKPSGADDGRAERNPTDSRCQKEQSEYRANGNRQNFFPFRHRHLPPRPAFHSETRFLII